MNDRLSMVLADTEDIRDLPSNVLLRSGIERRRIYELAAAAKAATTSGQCSLRR